MAIALSLGINLVHSGNKSGESLRIKCRLVNAVLGLETPFEADIEPGVRLIVGPAVALPAPALVVGDDGELDFAAWVAEGGGYAGLISVDGELFGLARNGLKRGFAVAVMFEERRRRLDETKGKRAQLFVKA